MNRAGGWCRGGFCLFWPDEFPSTPKALNTIGITPTNVGVCDPCSLPGLPTHWAQQAAPPGSHLTSLELGRGEGGPRDRTQAAREPGEGLSYRTFPHPPPRVPQHLAQHIRSCQPFGAPSADSKWVPRGKAGSKSPAGEVDAVGARPDPPQPGPFALPHQQRRTHSYCATRNSVSHGHTRFPCRTGRCQGNNTPGAVLPGKFRPCPPSPQPHGASRGLKHGPHQACSSAGVTMPHELPRPGRETWGHSALSTFFLALAPLARVQKARGSLLPPGRCSLLKPAVKDLTSVCMDSRYKQPTEWGNTECS